MSDEAAAPAKSQYRLYTRMAPVMGVIAILISFAEADQRGLLFKSNDLAFLADEAALAMPNGTGKSYFSAGDRVLPSSRPRNIGGLPARRVAASVVPETVDDISSPAAGGASRLIDRPVDQNRADFTFGGSTPSASGSTVTLRDQGSPGPGFPDSPIGLIAVNADPAPNPGPVVPPVPEPASWLLMILGVGWLGLSLRRRSDAQCASRSSELLVA